MVEADGLALHLNPLHEALQFDGNTNFRQLREKIRRVCEELDVPVIIKGVGTGISSFTARALKEVGIQGIDVSGSGGTCWALVEYYRAKDPIQKNICKSFQNWGIPTAKAIQAIRKDWPDILLIGSGGIRTGLDGAKALALGADLFGMALPLLKPATQSASAVKDYLYQVIEELKLVMFGIGSQTLDSLKRTPLIQSMSF
jgi:isopentenyl-diphosphate delta-isomerase